MDKQGKGTAGSLGSPRCSLCGVIGMMTSSSLYDATNQAGWLALPQYPESSQDGVIKTLGQVPLHGWAPSSDPLRMNWKPQYSLRVSSLPSSWHFLPCLSVPDTHLCLFLHAPPPPFSSPNPQQEDTHRRLTVLPLPRCGDQSWLTPHWHPCPSPPTAAMTLFDLMYMKK